MTWLIFPYALPEWHADCKTGETRCIRWCTRRCCCCFVFGRLHFATADIFLAGGDQHLSAICAISVLDLAADNDQFAVGVDVVHGAFYLGHAFRCLDDVA